MVTKYEVNNETRYFKDKQSMIDNGFWQPTLVYNLEVKTGFKKSESIPLQFTSNKIFDDEKEAGFYLGFYAQELVDAGDLPADVIITDNGKKRLDETKVKPMLKHLTFAVIETGQASESN